MALYLTEGEIRQLLTMEDTISVVEKVSIEQASGGVIGLPRFQVKLPHGLMALMAAAVPALGAMGYKAYTYFQGKLKFLVTLYSTKTGDLSSIMEADYLGQMRTGAASAVAAKYMARGNASTVGIFGTGWHAGPQLAALCAIRDIHRVKAYSRNPERKRAFCDKMREALRIEVIPAETPEEVVRGAEIIVTATTATEPVFRGEWLEPGTHINAIGGNFLTIRELDETAVLRSDIIVTDSVEQAERECGDLFPLMDRGVLHWRQVHELWEVVAGRIKGRNNNGEITLFESQGIAVWDIATAARVYELAKAKGVGSILLIG